jgi:hypothetical protein
MKLVPAAAAFFAAGLAIGMSISRNHVHAQELDPGNRLILRDSQRHIAALEQDNTALEKELQEARPYVVRARTLPVKLETRKSSSDGSLVLRLALERHEIPVRITFSNATYGAKSFNSILKPCAPWIEIGTFEGWKGLSGDSVEIFSDGYEPKVATL